MLIEFLWSVCKQLVLWFKLKLKFQYSPPPTYSATGISQNWDNSSTISDANGNLLFYTDGMTVYDKNSNAMPNGTGLIGDFTAGACALIIPIPCSNKRYVIFHNTEFSNPGWLHYSVVDMNLNGGLGDVVVAQKNISLGSGWTEKLCAYYNSTNNCYWVVDHLWMSDQFVAFKVDMSTIATTSVVSAVGSIHNCGTVGGVHDAMGQLTISQDGSKIVNALTCQDIIEIFDFNQNTGVISNPITLSGDGGHAWATAFSPNSQKLYTNSIFGSSIYQFDLTSFTYSAIASSSITIYNTMAGGYNFGYMELGPDGKIYTTRPNTNYISVINNPNLTGPASNFSFTGQSTGTANATKWGLSRIAYNIPQPLSFIVTPTLQICSGQFATLSSTVSGGVSPLTYSWSNGSTSSSISVSPSLTTNYTFSIIDACGNINSTVTTVSVVPSISISGSPSVCIGNMATLVASGAVTYSWSTGSTSTSIYVTPTTTSVYTVTGTNICGTSSQQYTVTVNPLPPLMITGSRFIICLGDSISFFASGGLTYTWSTGSTNFSIGITPTITTVYSVTTTNSLGCQKTDSIQVIVDICDGINKIPFTNIHSISVYPNPAYEFVTFIFTSKDKGSYSIKLFDVFGRLVKEENKEAVAGENSHLIYFDDLTKGLYMAVLEKGNDIYKTKIIKQN